MMHTVASCCASSWSSASHVLDDAGSNTLHCTTQASGNEDADTDDASDDESDGGNDVESVDMSDGEKEQMAAGAARGAPPSKRRRR